VNLVSVLLLHGHHDGEHEDDKRARRGLRAPAPDHNHRAALAHVMADTLTSALAIGALLAGRFLGWLWVDAASGVVGGFVILKWCGAPSVSVLLRPLMSPGTPPA